MSRADYVVSCPYCRRQYRMKLDRDEVTQKRTRATCGRCGNSFELAPRITVQGAAALAPPLPTPGARRPPPPPPPIPKAADRVVEFTADAEDETDDLGSAVAAAAEQIAQAPKGQAPQAGTITTASSATIGAVKKTSTRIAAQKSTPSIPAQKSATKIAAQKSSPKIPTQEDAKKTVAGIRVIPTQEDTKKTVAVLRAIPAPPPRVLTWLERADPGLAGLHEEPSPAALALEELL